MKTLPSSFWQPILDKFKSKFTQWGAPWLNPVGRIMLLNYVLNSLLLYQFPMLLAPTYFCNSFARELQRFLWQGGKSNSKRFHPVNWKIVYASKTHGGLGIRDPIIMNKFLGAKILWRLITGKKELWKFVLNKKYFSGPRMRCIDNLASHSSFSQI
jgi:hypothetical protein